MDSALRSVLECIEVRNCTNQGSELIPEEFRECYAASTFGFENKGAQGPIRQVVTYTVH